MARLEQPSSCSSLCDRYIDGQKGPLCRSTEALARRPSTVFPVKRGEKILDWYLSAPTSVRALERAADNSKPAARIASSGINGNSRVAIGAAPQGRLLLQGR